TVERGGEAGAPGGLDLPADLASQVPGGADVDVQVSAQEVGDQRGGERLGVGLAPQTAERVAADRARELVHRRPANAGGAPGDVGPRDRPAQASRGDEELEPRGRERERGGS